QARAAAQLAQAIADNRIGAGESEPAQFFQQADGGDIGIALQKLNDVVVERIQETLRWLSLFGGRPAASLFMLGDDLGDGLTVHRECLRNASMRGSAVEHPDDVVASRFVHRVHTPWPCRR